jgi:hypothetical protein
VANLSQKRIANLHYQVAPNGKPVRGACQRLRSKILYPINNLGLRPVQPSSLERSSTGLNDQFGVSLPQWWPFYRFSIDVKNLKVMNAGLCRITMGPDDFFVHSDFDQLHVILRGVMARNDRVPARQSLYATCIVDGATRQIIVGYLPNGFSILVHLDHEIAQGTADQRMAVAQTYRREGHIWGLYLPNDFALRRVFADDFVEQLRNKVISVRKFASHAGLQMVVFRLGLQRNFDDDLTLTIDFQQPWLCASFRDEKMVLGDGLNRVDFRLRALELEDDLVIARDFDRCTARILFALGKGQEDVAVWQDPAVARTVRIAITTPAMIEMKTRLRPRQLRPHWRRRSWRSGPNSTNRLRHCRRSNGRFSAFFGITVFRNPKLPLY